MNETKNMKKEHVLQLVTTAPTVHVNLETASMRFDAGATQDNWKDGLRQLTAIDKVSMFMLGDAMIFGEKLLGKKIAYKEAEEITGKTVSTLKNAVMVARQIPPAERYPKLGLDAHKAVVPVLKLADRAEKDAGAEKTKDSPAAKEALKKARDLRKSVHEILAAGGSVQDIRAKANKLLGKKKKKAAAGPDRQAQADTFQANIEDAADFINTLTEDEIKKDGKAWLFSCETICEAQKRILAEVIRLGVMTAEEASQKLSCIAPPMGERKMSETEAKA